MLGPEIKVQDPLSLLNPCASLFVLQTHINGTFIPTAHMTKVAVVKKKNVLRWSDKVTPFRQVNSWIDSVKMLYFSMSSLRYFSTCYCVQCKLDTPEWWS